MSVLDLPAPKQQLGATWVRALSVGSLAGYQTRVAEARSENTSCGTTKIKAAHRRPAAATAHNPPLESRDTGPPTARTRNIRRTSRSKLADLNSREAKSLEEQLGVAPANLPPHLRAYALQASRGGEEQCMGVLGQLPFALPCVPGQLASAWCAALKPRYYLPSALRRTAPQRSLLFRPRPASGRAGVGACRVQASTAGPHPRPLPAAGELQQNNVTQGTLLVGFRGSWPNLLLCRMTVAPLHNSSHPAAEPGACLPHHGSAVPSHPPTLHHRSPS